MARALAHTALVLRAAVAPPRGGGHRRVPAREGQPSARVPGPSAIRGCLLLPSFWGSCLDRFHGVLLRACQALSLLWPSHTPRHSESIRKAWVDFDCCARDKPMHARRPSKCTRASGSFELQARAGREPRSLTEHPTRPRRLHPILKHAARSEAHRSAPPHS